MDGKPRNSLIEVKRALVIEEQRNSPGLQEEVPRRLTGAAEEDISAAVEVGLAAHRSAAAEVGLAEVSAAAAAVAAAAVAAAGVDLTFASKKISYP
jgi:hypothetical protein